MGYTHYWYRKTKEIDRETFQKIVTDCGLVCMAAEIPLAGTNGKGKPEFDGEVIGFNGVENCGHKRRNLGITWPAAAAQGVEIGYEPTESWFAGAALTKRTCDGDCSHESFYFPRIVDREHPTADGYFNCTKTAYKPYDWPLTACLIVAKHYLGDGIKISSDGENKDWEDGRRLCQHVLGYGKDFKLKEENEDVG